MREINPLNVTECRVLEWMPKHFTSVTITDTNSNLVDKIEMWIYQNLKGRFCKVYSLDYKTIVFGFEDSAEATYFSLAKPNFRSDRF